MRARIACLFLCAGFAWPQAFEVASVKPASPDDNMVALLTYPGGRVTVTLYTLEMLIVEAFDVRPFQVSGGPHWMKEDRYDIVATPPASSAASKANPPYPKAPPSAEQRRMLLALLEERFHLQYHRETKEGPVYLLTKSNKPLKLKAPANKDEFPWAGSLDRTAGPGLIFKGENISMPQLAVRLSGWLVRPVFDRTGIEGSFDFQDEYASDDVHPDRVAAIVSSVSAIGLRLESAKGPVERIIIDGAEKPAEN